MYARMSSYPSSVARRAALISVVLTLTGSGCAEDSTSPPATGSGATPVPPVVDKHGLTADGKAIFRPRGEPIPINPKRVTGYLDAATPNGTHIDLNGWVALADLSGPADGVVAIAGKRSVAAVPTVDRPDVVDGYDQPGLEHTGFGISVPLSALDCSAPRQGLKTYAVSVSEKAAAPLTWLSDVGQIIRDACRSR